MNLAGISPVLPQTPTSGTTSPPSSGQTSAVGGTGLSNEQVKTNQATGVSETDRSKNPGTPGNPELSGLNSNTRSPTDVPRAQKTSTTSSSLPAQGVDAYQQVQDSTDPQAGNDALLNLAI